jgi:hypothetical protein
MSAKEKAKELIEKYQKLDIEIGGQYDGYLTMKIHDAKQCALIAVDEMLDFRNGLYMNEGSIVHQYLMDVKQEIEKL